jgi:hypothetical protein
MATSSSVRKDTGEAVRRALLVTMNDRDVRAVL